MHKPDFRAVNMDHKVSLHCNELDFDAPDGIKNLRERLDATYAGKGQEVSSVTLTCFGNRWSYDLLKFMGAAGTS